LTRTSSERGADGIGDGEDGVGIADVGGLHQGLAAMLDDAPGHQFERLPAPPGENDVHALARQRQRGGFADAGAGTRHPGNLSLKAFHALASCCPERAAPRSLRWIFGS
jgi:hypothetical protein